MGEHQIGGKGGWGMNQSSGQPPIKRLPNEMPIPSMASIIATLSPGQFPLSHPIWKNRCALTQQRPRQQAPWGVSGKSRRSPRGGRPSAA